MRNDCGMFASIINDLSACGLSEADIAKLVNTTAPTINRIKRAGQMPLWPLGDKLVRLHAEICGRDEAAHEERGQSAHEMQEAA